MKENTNEDKNENLAKKNKNLIWILIIVVISGLLSGFIFFLWDRDTPSKVYEKAVTKLLEESPSESLEYLLESDIKKPRELYLMAYNFHLEGNHEKAESLVSVVLLTEPNPKLEGSCYYLLGLIERSRGTIEKEVEYFTKSLAFASGRNEKLFKMELAYTYLSQKQFDQFLTIITPIESHVTGRDLFRFHQMMCRYYWYTEKYEEVLALALKMDCLGSNRCESIRHLEITFAYLLNNNLDAARQELELIEYHDPSIDEMAKVFFAVIKQEPIENPSPKDKELTSMVEWFRKTYGR